jgi:hypothetical protein
MLIRQLKYSYLALLIPVFFGTSAPTQSGRGTMHGYLAFDDVSYNDVTQGAIKAKVELRGSMKSNAGAVYSTETNNRGAYDFPSVGMGEYTLTITAPAHTTYRADLYIPSDFECRLATMLKKAGAGRSR